MHRSLLLDTRLPLPAHAHLMRAVAVQQEQSSQLEAVIVGAVVHVASSVYGIDAVAGAKPGSVTALTRTGIAPPVESPKSWWPITFQVPKSAQVLTLQNPPLPTKIGRSLPPNNSPAGTGIRCIYCRKLTSQNTRNLTRMARDGDVGAAVGEKDVVEDLLRANVLVGVGLAVQGLPQRVVLGEAGLKGVGGEGRVDVGLGTAAVARVAADGLAEELFDLRHKGVEGRQVEAGEGEVGGREAAGERRGVVALGRGDLLLGHLLLPERVDGERLLHAERRQARVRPRRRRVAVLFRPEAVPPGRAVVRLGCVMVPLAVPAHVQHLVLSVGWRRDVERRDLRREALPLRLAARARAARVGRVRAVDQAEVGRREVERVRVRGRVVLQEVAGHRRVVDVRLREAEDAERDGPACECEVGEHFEKKRPPLFFF